ncbi:hypothetical protein DOMOVOI_01050 [Brevundimonas phage vB_BpoS-Domovoi]|uniref:Uncharacterized protein n=1 Tax=Brevundimonas phage vB_BpoS-Domovoi TaxID=2948598 RepID=A0A9E7MQJ0_9CAUD|nr:hypothetical protein DOMOVOI_01050 [Brevundimonas phage vB_BpoS-Domovoi]
MTDETIHPAAIRLINAVMFGFVAEGLREADKASTLAVNALRELQHLPDGELQIALDRAMFRGANSITDLEWGAKTIQTLREVLVGRGVARR